MIKVVAREGESLDELLARFKKQVKQSNILIETRLRESYLPKKLHRKLKADLMRRKRR
jgi:ribosomal protein S21